MKLPPTINRSLILIVPKQPFYDWSNALFPDLELKQASEERDYNSYLLEDELFLDNPKKELTKYWKAIFLNQLFGQCTDESTYPKLTWKLFTEWFDFYKSSIVSDLTDQPIELQNDEY